MNLAQLIRLPGFDREAYEADLRAFKSQQAAERKAEKVDNNSALLRSQNRTQEDLMQLESNLTLMSLMSRLHAEYANRAIRRTVDTPDRNGEKILPLPPYHRVVLVLVARAIETAELEKWGVGPGAEMKNLVSP